MNRTIQFIILFVALTMVNTTSASNENNRTEQEQNFSWPNGAKAAISLAYDDALHSQLDNALPQLNQHKLKATFYITLAADSVNKRLNEWRSAAKQGHELGNHTLFHPCRKSLPNRGWLAPFNDLDNQTTTQYKREIITANNFLHAIDGETVRTITLPCTDELVGGKSILSEIDHLFIGIKSQVGGVPKSMAEFNVKQATVLAPSNVSGKELINYAKQAAQNGTIANYTFHGIGGDHLSISKQAHQELLTYLANNPQIYWVATYKQISQHLAKH